jgi:hypothetical protein
VEAVTKENQAEELVYAILLGAGLEAALRRIMAPSADAEPGTPAGQAESLFHSIEGMARRDPRFTYSFVASVLREGQQTDDIREWWTSLTD